ncbi:hypothetical protein D3C87_2169250 [compost metagenome]
MKTTIPAARKTAPAMASARQRWRRYFTPNNSRTSCGMETAPMKIDNVGMKI